MNKRAARWNMSDEGAIPWKRAASGDECIDWILEDETNRYAVLLEKTANYLLSKSSSCGTLDLTSSPFSATESYTRVISGLTRLI